MELSACVKTVHLAFFPFAPLPECLGMRLSNGKSTLVIECWIPIQKTIVRSGSTYDVSKV